MTRARWPTPSTACSTTRRWRSELVANGLDVVEQDFDWERRTDEFAEILDGVAAGRLSRAAPAPPEPPPDVVLSIVVLAWDNLEYTQRFVESVRQHTDVPYELIVVDNGSQWEAAHYADAAADNADPERGRTSDSPAG